MFHGILVFEEKSREITVICIAISNAWPLFSVIIGVCFTQ